jgi:hypothetical protein
MYDKGMSKQTHSKKAGHRKDKKSSAMRAAETSRHLESGKPVKPALKGRSDHPSPAGRNWLTPHTKSIASKK